MSDYMGHLERALRDAAIREHRTGAPSPSAGANSLRSAPVHDIAQQRVPSKRAGAWRWPPLALTAAALLVSGSAAAAIVALVGTSSAPLSGVVPGIAGRLLRYDIPVTPDLEPGNAGWCSEPRFSIKGAASVIGGETCSPAYQPGAPALLAGGEPISNVSELFKEARQPLNERQGRMILFWMVVSPRVAAVRLRGEVVASRADPRLPAGWRAVVAFISDRGAILPIPLDRGGRPITEPETMPRRASRESGTLTTVGPYHPGGAAPSPCSIFPARLPMVTGQWEVVAATAPALGSAVGRGVLFSCARSWFSGKGQSQAASAAVLLGAQDPRRPAPPLPGLRPTAQPSVYSDDGGASGEILAKRVGHAWLVVQGQSVELTKALLSTLRVKGQSVHDSRLATLR